MLLTLYSLCVVVAAAVVAPHELPYNLGAVPKALQMPMQLPGWLAAEGAVARIEPSRLPWWCKLDPERKGA